MGGSVGLDVCVFACKETDPSGATGLVDRQLCSQTLLSTRQLMVTTAEGTKYSRPPTFVRDILGMSVRA
jgi:hypothetical protein